MALPELRNARPATRRPAARAAARRGLSLDHATPLLVALFAYALMLWSAPKLLHDGDTFFHIAAGNWIWAHGQVPHTDPFSFTMRGAPWIAHEWLAEFVLAAAYAALGWTGVVAASAAAIAAAFWQLTRFLETKLHPTAMLLGLAASFLLAAPHLLARPHVFAMPILVAWMIALEKAPARGRPPSLYILPLMTLWANLHGGFVIGLALIGLPALEAVLAAPDWTARKTAARAWGGFFLAAALAATLTPNGFEGPLFAFRLARQSFSLDFIGEWHSTDFTHFQPLEIWILGLLLLGFWLRPRLPWTRLALLLGLVHLSLAHARNTDLLALIGPVVLAQPLAQALGRKAQHRNAARPDPRLWLVGGAAALLLSVIAWIKPVPPLDQRVAPKDALAAATAAGAIGPVFNAYDFGGYLVFAGVAPFVDGRVDVYGDAFMEQYADAVAARGQALPRLLDRYHIAWTLLQPQMPAVAALDRSPDWVRVYGDANAVVHRRRGGMPSPRP
ncbi:MAG TPA: hypothetical protein VJR47_01285 [Stellaceae bacterium]|nr:hypothetical protein [Stellaceae bacterium]